MLKRRDSISVSFILPAFNEEENLLPTVNTILDALKILPRITDYEITIFNDGSIDGTGALADKLSKNNPCIKTIHNPVNKGHGYCVLEGRKSAQKMYSLVLGADNDMTQESITAILSAVGKADIITTYSTNTHDRSWKRRLLSHLYTTSLNLFFGLKLRYFNGPCLIPTKTYSLIFGTRFSKSFAIHSEILIKILKSNASVHEIGIKMVPRKRGKSKAISFRSFIQVSKTILLLWLETCLFGSSSQNLLNQENSMTQKFNKIKEKITDQNNDDSAHLPQE